MMIKQSMALLLLLLSCICAFNSGFVAAKTDANDASALNVLFSSLNSPGQLTGWTANGGDPCGQSWLGVSCSGSSVTSIKLSGLGLSGNLAYNMNNLGSLTLLDMSSNSLGGGSAIPYNLPPNLQTLNLGGNQFGGAIPYSISLMTSLKSLNLNRNQLQGNLSDMFSGLSSLTTMDLSFNTFTGDLPQSFTALTSLSTLYLENNQFTGSINVLANLPLKDLNVANNQFTGWIPNSLKKINSLQTGGNSWNTGPAPPPPPYMPPPPPPAHAGQHSGGSNSNSGGSGGSGIGTGGVVAIVVVVLVIAVVAFFLVRRWSRRSRHTHLEQRQPLSTFPSDDHRQDFKPVQQQPRSVEVDVEAFPPPVPVVVNIKPPPKIDHSKFNAQDSPKKAAPKKSKSSLRVSATVYSVADLQMATDNFSADNLVAEGAFGRVFKARFDDGKVLTVMKVFYAALPSQSAEEFDELVHGLSKLHHPNVSELVGYCSEHGQRLLVYEFHRNGSLHDLLHLGDEHNRTLSWNSRIKIALGSARALEYLHEVCSPSVVHQNFQSLSILLDSEFNPHVADAGFAGLIPDAEFQASNQSSGYSAPEVDMSGQYTIKSDVYSFGVVMLELLTGRKPFDISRPRNEQSLVRWATPQLHDIDALDRMVDPALKGLYPAKSLSRFADVIALCVQPEPEFRPPMSEVVQALMRLVQRANMTKRMLDGDGQDGIDAPEFI